MGPVWQMEWVAEGQSEDSRADQEEMLVSVSGDGHVVQWTIRKEFKGNSKSQSVCMNSLTYFTGDNHGVIMLKHS